ncbi:hypothetical protein ACIBCM_23215 [Streptomyces sp. NPDC051018]|uniref:hypothetical protein n=1 Tax=Streptomyces sp. NPDC051018 TaxID=3365639 RepID=UPI0037AFF04D
MKTCEKFARIQADYQRDVTYLSNHSERHRGQPSARASTKHAHTAKQNMARALSRHFYNCRLCG